MELRLILANSCSCSGWRVVVRKRPRQEAVVSSVRKLQFWEISSHRDCALAMSASQERFHNIQPKCCKVCFSNQCMIPLGCSRARRGSRSTARG